MYIKKKKKKKRKIIQKFAGIYTQDFTDKPYSDKKVKFISNTVYK